MSKIILRNQRLPRASAGLLAAASLLAVMFVFTANAQDSSQYFKPCNLVVSRWVAERFLLGVSFAPGK